MNIKKINMKYFRFIIFNISILYIFLSYMIKNIDSRYLYNYLSRLGPHLYYFNEKCEGGNDEIVKKIESMAFKYPSLSILEIIFDENSIINLCLKSEDVNKVTLYYDRRHILTLDKPNENEIKDIFNKFIECYNDRCDRLAANVGSKSHINPKNNNINNPKEKSISLKTLRQQRYDIKKYLNAKIKISDEKNSNKIDELNNLENFIKKMGYKKIAQKSKNVHSYEINIDKKTLYNKEIKNSITKSISKSSKPRIITQKQNLNSPSIFQKSTTTQIPHINKINNIVPNTSILNFASIAPANFIQKPKFSMSTMKSDKISEKYINKKNNFPRKLITNKMNCDTENKNLSLTEKISKFDLKKSHDNKYIFSLEEKPSKCTLKTPQKNASWYLNVELSGLPGDILDE